MSKDDAGEGRLFGRQAQIWAAAIVLLALALRLYRLDGQSLWSDEGTSVALALRDLPAITQGAALDIHPPLYYYLLHYWMLVLGSGEIAVRSLSALLGAATVTITWLLGTRLFPVRTALAGAVLLAVSPLHIQYSQEARMYALATLLGVASAYAAVRAWEERGGRSAAPWLAAYAVCAAGALYSHYFAATILIAVNLAVGVAILRSWSGSGTEAEQRRDGLGLVAGWAVAQMAALAAFAPWLGVMAQQWTNWPATSQAFGPAELAGRVLTAYSAGLAMDPDQISAAAVIAGGLALAGLLPGRREKGIQPSDRISGVTLAALCALTPVAVMYLLSLRRPLYNAKFLLVALPGFYLLCAVGIERAAGWLASILRRGARSELGTEVASVAILLAAAVSFLPGLGGYYFDPQFARDDYRAIARTISASLRAGDAVLLNAPGQGDIFGYYYKGAAPVYPLPRQRPLDEADTAAQLEAIVGKHGRVWAVLWGVEESDPKRFVESWLDARTYKSLDRWFGNVRLALYAAPSSTLSMQLKSGAFFGTEPAITLLGYGLSGSPVVGGDILQIALYWQTAGQVDRRYKVFVHLLGPSNTLWGQRDSEPGGGLRPTTTWRSGETIQDNYGVQVLPGTPPGEYTLEVGLYDLQTGSRLQVRDASGALAGDQLLLGAVTVMRPAAPPAPESVPMGRTASLQTEGVRLLGFDLVQPGSPDPAQVVLYWQGVTAQPSDLVVTLSLVDETGRDAWSGSRRPVLDTYPSTRWQTGEVVRDPHPLPAAGLPAGRYRLMLSAGGDGWIDLDQVVVP